MLRALLFDFNGVLVDDEPLHLDLLLRVLADEGVVLEREAASRRFLGRDDRSCFATALAEAGQEAPAHRLARLVARKTSYYQERMRRDGYPFFRGALELVREASDAGVTLGVVSGALGEEIAGALRQAGVAERFGVVVSADDVDEGKPSPEGYRRAMQLLNQSPERERAATSWRRGLSAGSAGINSTPPLPERLFHPHEVLAVEDSPHGIAAARAAGLVTLGVGHSYPPAELAQADVVAERLDGLDLRRLQELYAEASRA